MGMRIALLLITLFAGSVASLSFAEEELFDTASAAAYREQGLAALRHRNYDAAIEAFEEAVSAAPDAESYYLLGYAYYLKGKTGDGESRQKAAENFSQAYQMDPNFTPSKFTPEELIAPQAGAGEESVGAAAPAGKREAQAPAEQPKSDAAAAVPPVSAPTATP